MILLRSYSPHKNKYLNKTSPNKPLDPKTETVNTEIKLIGKIKLKLLDIKLYPYKINEEIITLFNTKYNFFIISPLYLSIKDYEKIRLLFNIFSII